MGESNSKSKSSSKNKLFNLLLLSKSNPNNFADGEESPRAVTSSNSNSGASSPFIKSPWTSTAATSGVTPLSDEPSTALLCSLTREQGHLYSLAAAGDLLYTGSDSKNIRVWKPCRNPSEFSAFKSASGLVKAIVISTASNKIFTGHQDGKIRVWRPSSKDPSAHKRVGTLPKLKDYLKSSINPSNYVEVRRHQNSIWLRHFDAVSCLSLDEEAGILYSGSWDKTIKVWRLSDSKCLESINAHDDAINSIVVGLDGLVFSGSADGTVKAWRRESIGDGGGGGHVLVRVLMRQESAVTAVAVSSTSSYPSNSWVVYCGSSDGVVRWWRRGIGDEGGALRGHRTAVLCLAAAGRMVMSGGADGRVCVWRRGSGSHQKVTELVGHVGPVKCLAVEREREREGGARGWRVYSGSLDKSVKVWRVAEEEEEDGHVKGEV